MADSPTHSPAESRYEGFSLHSVCWGYRDIFAKSIDGLFEQGLIGEGQREVTTQFFQMLKQADQSCFDHVLKEFLGAINPRTRWLMGLPGIFCDVVELGNELANARLHYGIRFFDTLGKGGFGDSPDEVRTLVTQMRRLRKVDEALAMSLMAGYRNLTQRLSGTELDLYIEVAISMHQRSPKAAASFLEGRLKTSETYIQSITQERRLTDLLPRLSALLQALVGYQVEIDDLGGLDSDELVERGSTVVCMYKWLYLPAKVRLFDQSERNRQWYMLCVVVAAGMLTENSFPRIHGHPKYRTCEDLVGSETCAVTLFQIVEYARVLRAMCRRWPGARRLIEFGLHTEAERHPPVNDAERLCYAVLRHDTTMPFVADILQLADDSLNLFDSAARLSPPWRDELLKSYPDLARLPLRPFGFLPDFLYPGAVSQAPKESMIADLKQQVRKREHDASTDMNTDADTSVLDQAESNDAGEQDKTDDETTSPACYLYDEWSRDENDYYRDFCRLREAPLPALTASTPPADIVDQARRVSRIFERFKPDETRKDKYLPDGEVINTDLLVEYLLNRKKEPAPSIMFYEKPRINRRDLAVLILLDSSGSTGETLENGQRVIDVEKHAALILGQGLHALGDRFAICGFSSAGHENCTYHVYKDFARKWDQAAIDDVMRARPAESTRIGPALRHSGWKLAQIDARQRLIIAVTDGRPMDAGYDPVTRYAQYDVQMACRENLQQAIHTFGISTMENSQADMEIMFPQRQFAILPDIRMLPRVLPQLYINLTT
jgi:nitric oxide reductase activation protein